MSSSRIPGTPGQRSVFFGSLKYLVHAGIKSFPQKANHLAMRAPGREIERSIVSCLCITYKVTV